MAISPARGPQRRIALVMGNGTYKNTDQLSKPRQDAEAMGATLAQMGFAVTSAVNLDAATTKQMISSFLSSAGNPDVSLLYYSGHGVQIKRHQLYRSG